MAGMAMNAGEVTEQQALQIAQQFMQGKQFKQNSLRRAASKDAGKKAYYVFNVEDNGGFVIVAGDDRVEPILGYSKEGGFDDGRLPENFRAWLQQMAAEIEAVRNSPAQARSVSEPQATPQRVAIHKALAPLIVTKWNQGNSDNVFNAHLPIINGERTIAGCVATAGAQVMYYYRWPEGPTQVVPGYQLLDDKGKDTSNGADTSKDLPSITFQWDKMKTKYSKREVETPLTEEEEAVADLMLYCGYAAKMNYGVDASGASTGTLAEGMCSYFDYNPNTWKRVMRSYYSISEWDELIYNEIANGRPIIYSGSYSGGHAFICDGYDGAGMYHFNWGWGGNHDGYFKLQATNPYGDTNTEKMGYIADNYCIIGLQPNSWPAIQDPNADDEWEAPVIEGIVATASNVRIENTTVTMRLSNHNEETYGFGFGIGEVNSDGTVTPVDTSNERYKGTNLQQGYGFSNVSFDFSSYNLADGTHTLVPISIVNGESEWRRCKPADIWFEVNVANGVKTVTAHPIENLQINRFELVTGGTPGFSQAAICNITNYGDNYAANLYLYIGTEDDNGEYQSRKKISIATGNTKEYRMTIGKLEAGTYVMRLVNVANVVLAQKTITITQDLQATRFDVESPVFTNSDTKVVATVENRAGDYAFPLYLFAGKSGSKKLCYAAGSAIESGGSEEVTFYFTPTAAGTWNLYVTADKEGKNVIGETTTDVAKAPTGEVTLQVIGRDVKCEGSTVTYTMNVQNVGSTTNYRAIRVYLYLEEDGVRTSLASQWSPKVVIEPGETKPVTVTFEGLEEGKSYYLTLKYYKSFSENTLKSLGYDRFTFTTVKPGDANGDGVVDVADVVAIVNYILEKPSDNFDFKAADVNGDGNVDVGDVVAVVNIILTSGAGS
jgi:hypothetical protein